MQNRTLDTIIVENNNRDLKRLTDLLEQYPNKFKITSVSKYNEAVNILLAKKFDLAIFDVRLDNSKNCFQLIEAVGNSQFTICAITSRRDEAKLSQVYLAKNPIWFPKIHDNEKIRIFMKDLNKRLSEIDMATPSQNRFGIWENLTTHIPILIENICCVQANDKMTYFYYWDNKDQQFKRHPSNENLASVIERLNEVSNIFIQCQKGWVVNIDKVVKVTNEVHDGGEGTIYLTHDKCSKIPLGGVYKEDVVKALNLRPKPSQKK